MRGGIRRSPGAARYTVPVSFREGRCACRGKVRDGQGPLAGNATFSLEFQDIFQIQNEISDL